MKENRYTMPQQFIDDPNVALKWKLYAYLNGFWISGKPVYARNDTLAKQFGKAERSIQEALAELEKLGLITRDIRGLSRYILPGGIKEGRGSASPTHESQPREGTSPSLTIVQIDITDTNTSATREVKAVPDSEESARVVLPRKYPNARLVMDELWPSHPKGWEKITTYLVSSENLFERGLDQAKGALRLYAENRDDKFCPSIRTPYDLDMKWEKLLEFKKRNEL